MRYQIYNEWQVVKSIERGIYVAALKAFLELARKDNTGKLELTFRLAT
jgi:hypothetical protein